MVRLLLLGAALLVAGKLRAGMLAARGRLNASGSSRGPFASTSQTPLPITHAGAAAAPSTTTSTSSLDSNDGDDGTSRRILQQFLRIPSNYSLAEHLLTITAEPHLAGTLGDFHTAQFVASKFEEFGLDAVSIPCVTPCQHGCADVLEMNEVLVSLYSS